MNARQRRRQFVTIHVAVPYGRAIWAVPRGFGQLYKRISAYELAAIEIKRPDALHLAVVDLLGLVGYAVTVDQVAGWSFQRRVEAIVYAATEHARASDNPIRRHPRPTWLPAIPWQGPSRGEGAFAGPTGTPVAEAA